MAVLSNLRFQPLSLVLLLACLMTPLSGCAGSRYAVHPVTDAHGDTLGDAHVADRRLVPADTTWTLPDQARIPVRIWEPAGGVRAVILALHGFNDSRDAWEIPGPQFAARGIALYAPDQRGFGAAPDRGRWPGAGTLIDDAGAMLRLAAATHPGLPVFVMGESMGGAVALCLAARADLPPVAGFILLAPAVWSSTQMSPMMTTTLWAAATFLPQWQMTGRELPVHVQPSNNLAALYRLSYDPLTVKTTRTDVLRGLVGLMTQAAAAAPRVHGRVLISYGAHHQLVPPLAMAETWKRLPVGARRAYYPQGYHLLMRDQDRQDVIQDVVSWIVDPALALPSGADVAAAAWLSGDFWGAEVPSFLPANLDGLAGGR